MLIEEIESIMKSPSIFWFFKFKVTVPPFEPDFPHCEVAWAVKNIFEPKERLHFSKLIIDCVFVIKNIGAVLYTELEDNISNFESLQLKVLVPESASPDIDWYKNTPHLSILFLFPIPLHFNSVFSRTLAVFFPSTTTIWAPVAVPDDLFIVISPVE